MCVASAPWAVSFESNRVDGNERTLGDCDARRQMSCEKGIPIGLALESSRSTQRLRLGELMQTLPLPCAYVDRAAREDAYHARVRPVRPCVVCSIGHR